MQISFLYDNPMYTPLAFIQSASSETAALIDAYPFCVLACASGDEMQTVQLPLLRVSEGITKLAGHIARANPLAALALGKDVTALFTGPHAYISPSWYQSAPNVPTWNYASVIIKGVFRIVEDDTAIARQMRTLSDRFENEQENPWDFDALPDDYRAKMLAAIVPFEIEVTEVISKSKMSQNKPREDVEGVIVQLEDGGSDLELATALEMQKWLERKA